jgi:hypothetical protein
MKTIRMFVVAAIIGLGWPAFAGAADAMGDMHGALMKTQAIDGYVVSFHVMKAQAGQAMGSDHDFMVRIEKDGQVQTDLVVNSKLVCPDKSAASKMMMKMGDWYMAGYDMGQRGQYQLMVLFKTPDGSKHFGGVYYPAPAC